jgi:hypothetical protein
MRKELFGHIRPKMCINRLDDCNRFRAMWSIVRQSSIILLLARVYYIAYIAHKSRLLIKVQVERDRLRKSKIWLGSALWSVERAIIVISGDMTGFGCLCANQQLVNSSCSDHRVLEWQSLQISAKSRLMDASRHTPDFDPLLPRFLTARPAGLTPGQWLEGNDVLRGIQRTRFSLN